MLYHRMKKNEKTKRCVTHVGILCYMTCYIRVHSYMHVLYTCGLQLVCAVQINQMSLNNFRCVRYSTPYP